MTASLTQVAKRAGVSVATASRVTSGSHYPVAEQTRRRVQIAAQELGYTPNALARALATGRSRAIGVIVGDITDPYFAEIAKGLEEQAGVAGYLTMVCNADRSAAREQAYIRMLLDDQAAGIVIAGGSYVRGAEVETVTVALDEVRSRGVPLISLSDRGIVDVPVIDVDNVAVAMDATRYLVALGHRRVVYVPGPPDFTTEDRRRRGYVTGMEEAGLEPLIASVGGFDHRAGRSAAATLTAGGLPDAIVCFGEELAVGVLMGLRHAGVSVPGQVSLMGIDGTRYSEVLDLTSVKVPTWELGAMAARMIVGGEPLPERLVLPHRVEPRATTAPRNGD